MSALIEQIRRVRDARRAAAAAKARVDEPIKALRAQLVIEEDAAKQAAALLQQEEANLRALVLAAHTQTGEKKPAPGVEVKMKTTLQYDPKVAFEWAKKAEMALIPEQLDVAAFEKIAKATPLPFVTTLEVPSATIATDLDKVELPEPVAVVDEFPIMEGEGDE